MAQKIIWGYPFQTQGGLYLGAAPYLACSNPNSGTNPGFGVRMGARDFQTDPSALFASATAADVVAFNRGVKMHVSVSNPVFGSANYGTVINGGANQATNDAKWNSLFNRIKPTAAGGLGYLNYAAAVDTSGANLLGSYGGFTWNAIDISVEHEMDQPKKNVVAADYKAYVRHVFGPTGLAVTAGVRQYFNVSHTVTFNGIPVGRVDQYYAGDDVIDLLGIDFYNDFNSTWAYDGSTSSFATSFAPSLAWVRSHNKPFCCPEFSQAESFSDSDMQAWFTGIATTLNAATDVTCTSIILWSQASQKWQNSNKIVGQDPATNTPHLGKYNGIAAAIAATGGNAPPSSGTISAAPAAPTNVHVVSFSADGTQAVIGWDAAPTATPAVSHMRFYQATGVTTSLPNVGGDLAVASTITLTGLTPGGQQYTVAPTWENTAGNSGYGHTSDGVTLLTFATPTPGVGANDPTITNASAVQNPADPLEAIFSATATDPHALAITFSWSLLSPSGNIATTLTGANPTSGELTETGTWTYSVRATNSNGNFTTQVGTFPIASPADTKHTKYQGYLKPQTGLTRARDLGPLIRPFMDDVDQRIHLNTYKKSPHNVMRGLLGSAFDPGESHPTTVQAMTSGWAYWSAITLEDDHFGSIWFNQSVVQIGTGSQIAVYDSNLTILPNGVYTNALAGADGRTVDQAFQNTWQSGAVGGARYILPTPEVNRTPGETLYIQIYNTGASTPSSLRITTAPSTGAKLGSLGMAQPVFGGYNLGVGQTLPNALAVGSYVAQSRFWVGVGEITD